MLIYLHIGQLDDRYIPLKHAAEHDRLCPARWCGVGLAPTNLRSRATRRRGVPITGANTTTVADANAATTWYATRHEAAACAATTQHATCFGALNPHTVLV